MRLWYFLEKQQDFVGYFFDKFLMRISLFTNHNSLITIKQTV